MYPSIFNRFPVIQALKSKGSHFSTFFAHFGLPWVRPWDDRGKCYMDRKRIQCLSNASKHVHIYLQPFLRYSKLLVENCDIFTPHLCLGAPQGVTPSEFREDLATHKTRMNGLSCGEEIMTICSAVLIQYQRVTDGQTDRRTDVQPIAKTCFSIADARKNALPLNFEKLKNKIVDPNPKFMTRISPKLQSVVPNPNAYPSQNFMNIHPQQFE